MQVKSILNKCLGSKSVAKHLGLQLLFKNPCHLQMIIKWARHMVVWRNWMTFDEIVFATSALVPVLRKNRTLFTHQQHLLDSPCAKPCQADAM